MVCLTSIGERPTEGSSTSNIRGDDMIARAIASICCWPPLMLQANCRERSRSTGNAAYTAPRLCCEWARAVAGKHRAVDSRARSVSETGDGLPAPEPRPSPRFPACPCRPDRCARHRPPTQFLPRVTGIKPIMHFISVLLPLPLVPSNATVSPCRTSNDTPVSTRTAP